MYKLIKIFLYVILQESYIMFVRLKLFLPSYDKLILFLIDIEYIKNSNKNEKKMLFLIEIKFSFP